MVRYIAPVFTDSNGVRSVGTLSGPLNKPTIIKASVPFLSVTFRPGSREASGLTTYAETTISAAVIVNEALSPVPAGWTLDPKFSAQVEYDFIESQYRARGRRLPKSIQKPAPESPPTY